MKIFDFQQVIYHLLSLQKKSSPTAAVTVAFTVFENKKTKNFMKLEYISYTMTIEKQMHNKLRKDSSRSDDLLSSCAAAANLKNVVLRKTRLKIKVDRARTITQGRLQVTRLFN